ncbi:MAG: hypothetical protein PUH84_01920 [Firmicutes bacterium]|nr:hypothetical protein [Bacillota bacterium]MDY5335615.1 hypothetical protein [Bacilli bacterium]
MKEILNILLEYIISYALVFLLYYLIFIRKKTKYNKNKVPVEYYYLVSLYGLRQKDIDYKKFMYISGLVNTFIIVTTYIVVSKLLNKWFIQLFCGIVIIILLIIICYGILGRYYQKKQNIEKRK